MYDSGGISLKPSDGMPRDDEDGHARRGRGAGGDDARCKALGCKTKVTGYLMCTDNMPSGTALKLGDVLTMRNGKTVEIHNTDAEGRLVMADGLVARRRGRRPTRSSTSPPSPAPCLVALGTSDRRRDRQRPAARRPGDAPRGGDRRAGVAAAAGTKRYRKQLDSDVADMTNIGGPYGGAITAALFLDEFVGDMPWAHLDIAGPMKVDADDGWRAKGATGFGTRLLIDLGDELHPACLSRVEAGLSATSEATASVTPSAIGGARSPRGRRRDRASSCARRWARVSSSSADRGRCQPAWAAWSRRACVAGGGW